MNNAAEVVGWSTSDEPTSPVHIFLWSASTGITYPETLPILDSTHMSGITSTDTNRPEELPVLNSTYVSDINDSGEVVGSKEGRAFLWSASSGIQDLGTLPGRSQSRAYGVNNAGEVVGTSYREGPYDEWSGNPPESPDHAFVWSASSGMQLLETVPSAWISGAVPINNAGEVAGYYYGHPFAHGWQGQGFVWSESTGMQQFAYASVPADINGTGEVVGNSGLQSGGTTFVWSASSGVQWLGTLPGARSSYARAINVSGEVVGFSGGHAFL